MPQVCRVIENERKKKRCVILQQKRARKPKILKIDKFHQMSVNLILCQFYRPIKYVNVEYNKFSELKSDILRKLECSKIR